MQDEIKKILEMKDKGSISNDEAVELIAALSQPKPKSKETLGLGDIGPSVLNQAWRAIRSALPESEGNRLRGSKVTPVSGSDFDFDDNVFNLSNVSDLHFEKSAGFTDNKFEASSVTRLKMSGGEFTDTRVAASSVENFNLLGTEIEDCNFNACKLSDWTLENSQIHDCGFHGSDLRGLKMKDTELNDLSFQGCSIQNVEMIGCEFSDCSFSKLHMENVRFENVKVADRQISNLKLSNRTFTSTAEFLVTIQSPS